MVYRRELLHHTLVGVTSTFQPKIFPADEAGSLSEECLAIGCL